MRIAIIGAGNVGGTLTRRLRALGHDVAVANARGPESLAALAAETGAVARTIADVARGAELVIVAIPLKAVADLPAGVLDGAARDAIVIDAGNYVPQQRDGRIDALEDGLPDSRWTERRLGHPVIKAFNTIKANTLLTAGRPAGAPDRIAAPVAGDDAAAKAAVIALAGDLGFDGLDAGGLDDSWRQQPGTPVYTADLGADDARRALAAASPERPAAWRA
jgi:predicted dinucleotide-binding enzyme